MAFNLEKFLKKCWDDLLPWWRAEAEDIPVGNEFGSGYATGYAQALEDAVIDIRNGVYDD